MSNLSEYPPKEISHTSGCLSPASPYKSSLPLNIPLSDHTPSNNTIALHQPRIKRSGSPTPSEAQELKQLDGIIQKAFRKESWQDRQFIVSFAVLAVILTIVVVIAVFRDQIALALTPAAKWVKQAPAGFLIPIAFLILLSIPPLFGAEVIYLLCGFIYGLWVAFAIVCAGTIIGETLVYLGCRYWFRARAEKIEKGKNGSLQWPSLARVIREGGFTVAVVVRYSAIPTHISTALFAVCGVGYWTFLGSLVISFPLQIVGVYIGVLILDKANGNDSTHDNKISVIVLVITIAITILAMWWIRRKGRAAGLAIIRERRVNLNSDTSESNSGFDASSSAYPLPGTPAKPVDPAAQFPSVALMDV